MSFQVYQEATRIEQGVTGYPVSLEQLLKVEKKKTRSIRNYINITKILLSVASMSRQPEILSITSVSY